MDENLFGVNSFVCDSQMSGSAVVQWVAHALAPPFSLGSMIGLTSWLRGLAQLVPVTNVEQMALTAASDQLQSLENANVDLGRCSQRRVASTH